MAKKSRDRDLLHTLRESGLRKKVAKAVTASASRAKPGKPPSAVSRTIDSLRSAASELENRVNGSRRTAAAKKAAQTRTRNAAKRSASAKKAAKTRAKAGR
jgi:hypothetical protein